MWTINGELIEDSAWYTAPDGTRYPPSQWQEFPSSSRAPPPAPTPPPVPTEAEIVAAANTSTLSQLADIDAKSIRALREGDTARVAALEDQAKSLRGQLVR